MSLWLRWSNVAQQADLRRRGGNFLSDEGLETAVVISLFTDRRAKPDDEIPDGTDDRRGWWGDVFPDFENDEIGSRLWLLSRAKATQNNLRLAKDYTEEALAWMVQDGVAQSVEVETENQDGTLAIGVKITKPGDIAPTFQGRWELPYAV